MFKNPHFTITRADGTVYLRRWYLTPWSRENSWFRTGSLQKFFRKLPNIYIHNMLASDDDRALHDHPWANMSIVLKGGYLEHQFISDPANGEAMPTVERKWRGVGSVVLRKASKSHRLELLNAGRPPYSDLLPCWTLFATWGKQREWGFWKLVRNPHLSTRPGAVNYVYVAHWIHHKDFNHV